MLAQNFKTPADLGLIDAEFEALLKVLGMLEREELIHLPVKVKDWHSDNLPKKHRDNWFHMNCWIWKADCGTVRCMGGWAEAIMGQAFHNKTPEREALFFPGRIREKNAYDATPGQAAIALRNYLTFGQARWSEALAE